MPFLARRSPLNPGVALLAMFALLGGLFAYATVDAEAAKPKKKAPAVRAKIAKKTLSITGDRKANTVVLRLKRRARGTLEVDVAGTRGVDYRFRRTRFNKIVVRGGSGADRLRVDERNGVFTNTEKTTIKGDAGNDQLAGGAGRESISGGAGNDSVDGGAGADSVALGAGDDVARSAPNSGSDRVKGDAGADRLAVIGSAGDDALAASANGARLRIARGGVQAVDADGVEAIDFSALGGADTITVDDLAGTGVSRTGADLAAAPGGGGDGAADSVIVNGSPGADTIAVSGSGGSFATGGLASAVSGSGAEPGSDRLIVNGQDGNDSIDSSGLTASTTQLSADGGPGADSLTSGDGADVLAGGDGDDTFNWTAGDGSDRIEGQGGSDRVAVTGADGGETIDAARAEGRVRIARDGEALDIDDVEAASIDPRGGTDAISVDDLAGTDLAQAAIEAADGGDDQVTVNGSAGSDQLDIDGSGSNAAIRGAVPAADVHVDPGADNLTVNGQAGADSIDASGLAAGVIGLALNGGDDNDTLLGSDGPDTVIGGAGDDSALLGAGDDTFRRGPGDGSDIVEGQAGGADKLHVEGSDGNDSANVSANGARARFTGDGTADVDDVESVDVSARGGTDSIVAGDLAGTDVKDVNADLGEGARDNATATGTNGNDNVDVAGDASGATVTGLASRLRVTGQPDDTVTVDALGGGDVVDGSGLTADAVALTANGGVGNDVLRGGAGGDTFNGGDGTDVAQMGGGDDTFVWNPGDDNDVLEGQAGGGDRMVFNGSNAAENIDISANGGRVRFFRDIANVTMDLNDVENIDFNALGGADNVVVADLTGTDARSTDIDLNAAGGGQDDTADNVVVHGTQDADTVPIAGDASGVSVAGLPSGVAVTGAGQATDRLTLNAQSGADIVAASGLKADALPLTVNGGLGEEVVFGGEGNDIVNGGDGNDFAVLGAGDDTFVWNPGDDSDVFEGQAGRDRMLFNGANIAEKINITANGGRVRFTRDIAAVTMDLNDVEVIDFNALGGADTITAGDLSGTDLTDANLALAAVGGAGDGAADSVIVTGTNGGDVIQALGDASGVSVIGLQSIVDITGAEAANDRLTVDALDGDDVVEASGLAANAIALTANGGNDDDVLIGGSGNDTLSGGADDDVLFGGPGADVLDGGTGDNIVVQD